MMEARLERVMSSSKSREGCIAILLSHLFETRRSHSTPLSAAELEKSVLLCGSFLRNLHCTSKMKQAKNKHGSSDKPTFIHKEEKPSLHDLLHKRRQGYEKLNSAYVNNNYEADNNKNYRAARKSTRMANLRRLKLLEEKRLKMGLIKASSDENTVHRKKCDRGSIDRANTLLMEAATKILEPCNSSGASKKTPRPLRCLFFETAEQSQSYTGLAKPRQKLLCAGKGITPRVNPNLNPNPKPNSNPILNTNPNPNYKPKPNPTKCFSASFSKIREERGFVNSSNAFSQKLRKISGIKFFSKRGEDTVNGLLRERAKENQNNNYFSSSIGKISELDLKKNSISEPTNTNANNTDNNNKQLCPHSCNLGHLLKAADAEMEDSHLISANVSNEEKKQSNLFERVEIDDLRLNDIAVVGDCYTSSPKHVKTVFNNQINKTVEIPSDYMDPDTQQLSPVSVLDAALDEDEELDEEEDEEHLSGLQSCLQNFQEAKRQLLDKIQHYEMIASMDSSNLEEYLQNEENEEKEEEGYMYEDEEATTLLLMQEGCDFSPQQISKNSISGNEAQDELLGKINHFKNTNVGLDNDDDNIVISREEPISNLGFINELASKELGEWKEFSGELEEIVIEVEYDLLTLLSHELLWDEKMHTLLNVQQKTIHTNECNTTLC